MAEHSSNASCPVINQVIVQLQDRPHVFNNVSAVEKLKLFFWHQPIHVLSWCSAGVSPRFKHFLHLAFFQKISCISDKGSLQTFCRIIKGFAVMFATWSKTDFYQSLSFCRFHFCTKMALMLENIFLLKSKSTKIKLNITIR